MRCKYFQEHGELVFCSNKKNKESHEGNCSPSLCPLGTDIYQIIIDNKELVERLARTKANLYKTINDKRLF